MSETIKEEFILSDISELDKAVDQIILFANGRKKFTLVGDLGAGKTTLTQYFCKKIGVKDDVTSPTFSLVNEYLYSDGGREHKFYHLDLYRLKTEQEALDIGIEEYLYDENYCFVEWPEIIWALLPDETVHIKISILPDLRRKILLL